MTISLCSTAQYDMQLRQHNTDTNTPPPYPCPPSLPYNYLRFYYATVCHGVLLWYRYDGEDCSAAIKLKPSKPLPSIKSFFKKTPPKKFEQQDGNTNTTIVAIRENCETNPALAATAVAGTGGGGCGVNRESGNNIVAPPSSSIVGMSTRGGGGGQHARIPVYKRPRGDEVVGLSGCSGDYEVAMKKSKLTNGRDGQAFIVADATRVAMHINTATTSSFSNRSAETPDGLDRAEKMSDKTGVKTDRKGAAATGTEMPTRAESCFRAASSLVLDLSKNGGDGDGGNGDDNEEHSREAGTAAAVVETGVESPTYRSPSSWGTNRRPRFTEDGIERQGALVEGTKSPASTTNIIKGGEMTPLFGRSPPAPRKRATMNISRTPKKKERTGGSSSSSIAIDKKQSRMTSFFRPS